MSARLAQLAQHPEDAASLRQALELQAPASTLTLEVPALPADAAAPVDSARGTTLNGEAAPAPAPETDLPDPPILPRRLRPSHATLKPHLENYPPLAAFQREPSELPEWEGLEFDAEGLDNAAPASPRLQVKLFGSQAAHTLEIGPHRRSSRFMGVQVVTIESARALGSAASDGHRSRGGSGGYDWGHKLTVQLTPEEMPGAMAVLMNLCPSVRLGQHGPATIRQLTGLLALYCKPVLES